MRPYIAPLLWLTFSVLVLVFNVYVTTTRFQARLSEEKLAEVQKGYVQKYTGVVAFTGVYLTYAATRALLAEQPTWWLWFLAALAQFATIPVKRLAGASLGADQIQLDRAAQRRHRLALWLAVPATVSLFAGPPAAHYAERFGAGTAGAVLVVLTVAAMAGFVASGWATVWVSKDRKSDKDVPSPTTPDLH